jgi:hypothetical protein
MMIPVSELRDRRAVTLVECWYQRRGEAEFPARSDFDPLDLLFALGNIVLIQVMYDPLRFRFRLVGSNITRHLGHDSTGLYIDNHRMPEYRGPSVVELHQRSGATRAHRSAL